MWNQEYDAFILTKNNKDSRLLHTLVTKVNHNFPPLDKPWVKVFELTINSKT